MTTLLHVSDTHFGTERGPVVQALLRLARAERPDVAVLSGDITQRARRSEFMRARVFLDRLALPTLCIPGNHDIPLFNIFQRLFMPYSRYSALLHKELEPEFEAERLLVIGVRTTRRYRHEDGEVSAAQVARVQARLAQADPDVLKVVVTHQPVVVTQPRDKKNVLKRGELAVRTWVAAGADLVLAGHIHLPFVVPLHRRFSDLPRTAWAVNAGTAVSSRLRFEANNSVNIIRYGGPRNQRRCAEVERWDFVPARTAFECVSREELHFHARSTAE
ncbi:MAG: hypothetical protein RLZZ618_2904 [Pseudomonadota bacterium]|jgi:3',5'-cyclic AMP phosphodiesterase CpdA